MQLKALKMSKKRKIKDEDGDLRDDWIVAYSFHSCKREICKLPIQCSFCACVSLDSFLVSRLERHFDCFKQDCLIVEVASQFITVSASFVLPQEIRRNGILFTHAEYVRVLYQSSGTAVCRLSK